MLIFDLTDHFVKQVFVAKLHDHFVFMLLRFVLAAGASVGIAYLSRWHFEEIFLKLKSETKTKSFFSSMRSGSSHQIELSVPTGSV